MILATFFLWGLAQISLAFFLAALFNKSRLANISVILLVQWSVFIALGIDNLYPEDPLSNAYFLWPPFAFYRVLGILNRASYLTTQRVNPYFTYIFSLTDLLILFLAVRLLMVSCFCYLIQSFTFYSQYT